MTKLRSLQCLREITPDHVQSGTEFQICLLLRDPISDEIIYDINVSITLANLLSAIFLQFDSAMMILIDNIVTDILSILFHEDLVPYNWIR